MFPCRMQHKRQRSFGFVIIFEKEEKERRRSSPGCGWEEEKKNLVFFRWGFQITAKQSFLLPPQSRESLLVSKMIFVEKEASRGVADFLFFLGGFDSFCSSSSSLLVIIIVPHFAFECELESESER